MMNTRAIQGERRLEVSGTAPSATEDWRQEKVISEDQGIKWTIGPLTVWAFRGHQEWKLTYQHLDDALSTNQLVESPIEVELDLSNENLLRFASDSLGDEIALSPILADKAMVSTLEMPLHILPGHQAALFVSTPVWVSVRVGNPPRTLLEIPAMPSSYTWFGPSTREGELCYSSRTKARLHLENLPVLPHRVITKTLLRNRGNDTLIVERLSLPIPHFDLFENAHGSLWTQEIEVQRSEDGELAAVEIGKAPPKEAGACHLLASPRSKEGRGVLTRAVNALFG